MNTGDPAGAGCQTPDSGGEHPAILHFPPMTILEFQINSSFNPRFQRNDLWLSP
jgi:hypothetical protein